MGRSIAVQVADDGVDLYYEPEFGIRLLRKGKFVCEHTKASCSFLSDVHVSHRFQESSLTEEHQLSVTLFDTEVLIDGRLLAEE